MHEAAHHFDRAFRLGRSRWDLADVEKDEAWATRAEKEQGSDIVLPYIQERYPSERDDLLRWTDDRCGVALPFGPAVEWHSFALLAHGARDAKDRASARVAYARALHSYVRELSGGDQHEAALLVFEALAYCWRGQWEEALRQT